MHTSDVESSLPQTMLLLIPLFRLAVLFFKCKGGTKCLEEKSINFGCEFHSNRKRPHSPVTCTIDVFFRCSNTIDGAERLSALRADNGGHSWTRKACLKSSVSSNQAFGRCSCSGARCTTIATHIHWDGLVAEVCANGFLPDKKNKIINYKVSIFKT